jgi:hypothetical protein
MSAKLREADFVGAITARGDIRLFFIFGQDESAIAAMAGAMAARLGPEAEMHQPRCSVTHDASA